MKRLALALAVVVLAGCKALPDKPVRPVMYDFGPAPVAERAAAQGFALILPDVEVNGILETPALLYRLGYEDAHQLRPYAFARWSSPPGQLFMQRLRDVLGRERPVLDPAAGSAVSRRGGTPPAMLRVELEEFSQLFDAPGASRGMVRVRCTLLESTGSGERVVAQRSFAVDRAAPTADAPGGVRALTAATDAAAQDIAAWLRQR